MANYVFYPLNLGNRRNFIKGENKKLKKFIQAMYVIYDMNDMYDMYECVNVCDQGYNTLIWPEERTKS